MENCFYINVFYINLIAYDYNKQHNFRIKMRYIFWKNYVTHIKSLNVESVENNFESWNATNLTKEVKILVLKKKISFRFNYKAKNPINIQIYFHPWIKWIMFSMFLSQMFYTLSFKFLTFFFTFFIILAIFSFLPVFLKI